MDKLYKREQWYMLSDLRARVEQEPTRVDVFFDGKPQSFDVGPRWDFYVAFADIGHEHELFQSLIDDELIEPVPGKPRIHDDWRRYFPEYRYRITDIGQEVLKTPSKWVEPLPFDPESPRWNSPPTRGGNER